MIISRTPYRISFLGGGTDYPVWYRENAGKVLATTINKYCYITCRYLPPFFEHRSRIVYSKMELVKRIAEIEHPAVRECLRYMKIAKGIEIHHDGDLPARAGLGSSSAFTVGLLHVLYSLKGIISTKRRLALDAIYLEQEVMKEHVGSQDQVLAAFGGFNLIEFGGREHIKVSPITLNSQRQESFQSHLMLFFTGFSRYSSEIAAEQIKETKYKRKELKIMCQLVDEGVDILNSRNDLANFGKVLDESWRIKRSLSSKISNTAIDDIYSTAMRAGAIGGKILGAGGGGFMLIFARKETQPKIRQKLKNLLYVPFSFENLGSQIIFYTTQ